MKFFFLLFLILLSIISAAQVNIQRDSTQKGNAGFSNKTPATDTAAKRAFSKYVLKLEGNVVVTQEQVDSVSKVWGGLLMRRDMSTTPPQIVFSPPAEKSLEEIKKEWKASETKWLGKQAPLFSATDNSGKEFNLHQLKGKVVVLNFWFINCAPCRREMPQLNKLYQLFENNREVVFLSFALDDAEKIKSFLANNSFLYPVVPKAGYITYKSYEIGSWPTNIIIDKKGTIRFYEIGEKGDINIKMSDEIKQLLK
jgi:peroxiredoxin